MFSCCFYGNPGDFSNSSFKLRKSLPALIKLQTFLFKNTSLTVEIIWIQSKFNLFALQTNPGRYSTSISLKNQRPILIINKQSKTHTFDYSIVSNTIKGYYCLEINSLQLFYILHKQFLHFAADISAIKMTDQDMSITH